MMTTNATTTTTTTLPYSTSNLAGPVFTTSPTTRTIMSKTKYSPNHRPNKAELEARLYHAHIRAHNRRLRQSLGYGLPSNIPPRHRTTRTVAYAYSTAPSRLREDAPLKPVVGLGILASPTLFANTTNTTLPALEWSQHPMCESRPRFPHRRSRVVPTRGIGLGLQLDALEEDAIVSPTHVFPDTLRRTPGAPVRVTGAAVASSAETGGSSYFHLPSNLLTPVLPAPPVVGLGLSNVDFGEDGAVEYFPSLL